MIGSIQNPENIAAKAVDPQATALRLELRALPARLVKLLEPPTAVTFEGNRTFRRARSAFERIKADRRFTKFMRATAWVTTFAMLHMIYAGTPGANLLGQPSFQNFEQRSKNDAGRYVDRARRLSDADAWTNYVELGIAAEFIEWEEDALELVRKEFQNIDENAALDEDQKEFEKDLIRTQYEAAAVQWETDAEDYIYEQRGEYRAETAAVTIDPITEAEYAAIIADAQATMSATAELDLVAWDAALAVGRSALEQRFEDSLNSEMTRIRGENAALTGDELAAF